MTRCGSTGEVLVSGFLRGSCYAFSMIYDLEGVEGRAVDMFVSRTVGDVSKAS